MPLKPLNPHELARLLDAADAEAARRSLACFVKQAWSIIEPSDVYQHNWHIEAICEHLEAVTRGQIRKLVINIPPGFAKSLLVAAMWPAWVWTWWPEWKGIFSSYAQDLAVRDSVKARTLMESTWYQQSFVLGRGPVGGPLWRFSDDMNRKDMYTNTRQGLRMSLSVGSKATGFRGNAVVVDDPLNAKDAPSKLARDEVIYWWDKVMSSRINRPDRDAFVIIMQRLHEDDLTGHVLRAGGYEHLCLPAQYDSRRKCVTYTRQPPKLVVEPLTKGTGWHWDRKLVQEATAKIDESGPKEVLFTDPRQVDGDLLFPARFSAKWLAEQKVTLGSEGYAGQYSQNPAPPEGGLFKYAWWRFWRHEGAQEALVAGTPVSLDPVRFPRPPEAWQGPSDVLPKIRGLVGSLDAAFKGDATSDYVVFGVWGIDGARRYLLDLVRGKLDYVATKRELLRLAQKWPRCTKWLVEDKANGSAIVAELQGQIPGITPVNPEGGKESRAAAMSPQVEAGQVYLPEGAPWVAAFIEEHAVFPRGRHDDQVDMTSQVMTHLATSREAARAAMLFGV